VWVSNITYENLKISLYIVITFIKPTPRIEWVVKDKSANLESLAN
jgi:hypothetical protein